MFNYLKKKYFSKNNRELIFWFFLTQYDKRGIFSFYKLALKIYFDVWMNIIFEYNYIWI